MSNYMNNTKKILKSFNENVVKPQLLNVEGQVGALSSDVEAKLNAFKGYVDGQDTQVLADAKAYAEGQVAVVDAKLDGAVATINGTIGTLEGRVSTNESDITNLKNAVANKNNNTIVVDTEDEIAIANPTPKIGDLAYVISSKRAYIYKGEVAQNLRNVPFGWVVFDEITSELDLVKYAKIEFVEGKIAEVNGTIDTVKAELEAECELKATKVELGEEVKTLNERIDGLVINGGDTTQEVEALKVRVEANEGAIANHEARMLVVERETALLSDEEIAEIIGFVLA